MTSMFMSLITADKTVVFPEFTGTRVMMMPFRVDDPHGTLPHYLQGYAALVAELAPWAPSGVGYLTVDECGVRIGDTHRRPGLHVDGVGEDGLGAGAYGGGGGYAAHGMVVAASVEACRGWVQSFDGTPGPDGDCSHLESQLNPDREVRFKANRAYWCGALAVHESLPVAATCRRQFLRVSMPSSAPWHEGYTPNPLGILPAGRILPRRQQMGFRPLAPLPPAG